MKKWALVTGAAQRIGRCIALDLASAGWDIVIHYNKSQAEAETLADEIQKHGRVACLAEIDLTKEKAVAQLIPQLTAELGPLQALINNASRFVPDAEDTHAHLHEAINATAPRILSDAFFKSHEGTHWPQPPAIINMLDADATKPAFTTYNRSKALLADMTRSLALEFAPRVRVNGVAPGPTLPSPRQSEAHFDALVAATPLQKRIYPEQIASAVRFLIENPVVTGEIIHVDGGAHLKSRT